ncbi:UPF0668 protein-like [Lachnellula suecica]|uniref:UPF0668 protein-like n=1 Tax=Lachnellula suecica TaxID=602035 RepID=A0A8T9C040_9HELO|nr:UPF0668 protein-like [Lachnellula suecica]
MEPSPLTQQARPEVFQQKIVELYEALFKDEDDNEKSEGFWREFFLLRPDKATLQRILDELSPNDLLHLQAQTRQLFLRAVGCIKAGSAPADAHALDTVTAFLVSVLSKKYNNASSDIINVLAGLDEVDAVFTDFVAALDVTIKIGRTLDIRQKAIEVALAVVSGAYQTSLLSYFTHRDLFPSLMKFIQDSDTTSEAFEPFTLLGLLANYNKFESQNPYRLRLDDFVNEGTIQKIIRSVGHTCTTARGKYVAIQEDLPEGWTLSNTLNMIGLGAIAPGAKNAPPTIDPELAKEMFAKLPGTEAAVLLATYDFAHANKLFCFNFVSLPAEKGAEAPIGAFVSLTSYLLQHAHSSFRTSLYSHLNLLILRLLIEDQVLCKKICSDESKMSVRLCRQRSPYLPPVRGDRMLAASILDTMIDGINHNLRRRLDVDFYILCVGIILRLISHLSRSRTRLTYHWSELFRSLLALVRFLTTYTTDLKHLNNINTLLDDLVNLIALSLSAGEAFLPGPAAYDDLFYKLVETGEVLIKFRDNYELGKSSTSSIDTLISVNTHYKQLLEDGASGRRGKQLTNAQVSGVIKQGYETLSIQAKEGLDSWDKYREADKKTFLKKMSRTTVADVKDLINET